MPSDILGCRSCNVAVYCRTGSRTQGAAPWLEAAGFTNVYDIVGVLPWYNAGLPLEIGPLPLPQPVPACNTTVCTTAPDGDSTSYVWVAPVGVGALALPATAALLWRRRPKNHAADSKLPSVGGASPMA